MEQTKTGAIPVASSCHVDFLTGPLEEGATVATPTLTTYGLEVGLPQAEVTEVAGEREAVFRGSEGESSVLRGMHTVGASYASLFKSFGAPVTPSRPGPFMQVLMVSPAPIQGLSTGYTLFRRHSNKEIALSLSFLAISRSAKH